MFEDYNVNRKLYPWHHNTRTKDEPALHLYHYHWQPLATKGSFKATRVLLIVPGLGMLANPHPGLVNICISGYRIVKIMVIYID